MLLKELVVLILAYRSRSRRVSYQIGFDNVLVKSMMVRNEFSHRYVILNVGDELLGLDYG